LITDVEKMGGMVQCISTRENLLYCIDFLRENADAALNVIGETIMEPAFPEEELAESRMIVELQQTELPSQIFSRDLVQRAAYQGFPLSNHHFCPLEFTANINAKMLVDFRSKHFFGANCVLSGVGIEHDQLVAFAKKHFSALPSRSKNSIHRSISEYTGGMLSNERELKEPFVKLAMAYECGGWKSKDLVPVCVLQQLLGGGSSFSAGGPGKGMYTRLYTQVLNVYHWAESVEAFVSIHEDAGLMGIDGACPPDQLASLIRTLVDQFAKLAYIPVSEEELGRAKNMLKSMMMMQLESRLVVCEDIARQFTTYGFRESPSTICAQIDAVTAQDLMRVAALMLERPPSVAAVGADLSQLPDYNTIKTFSQQYSHQMWLKAAQMGSKAW
jgi:mitochondrial-processing peptidase subunit alpha